MRTFMSSAITACVLPAALLGAVGFANPVQAVESVHSIAAAAKCVKETKDGSITIKNCGTLPTDRPAAPANVRAAITGPTEFSIRWRKADSGPVPTSYTVYAKSGLDVVKVCTTDKRKCLNSDFAVDKTYRFYVVPLNASGRGPAGISADVYLPTEVSPDGYR